MTSGPAHPQNRLPGRTPSSRARSVSRGCPRACHGAGSGGGALGRSARVEVTRAWYGAGLRVRAMDGRLAGSSAGGLGSSGDGVLVIAGTPIGNAEDAPPRLVAELGRAD